MLIRSEAAVVLPTLLLAGALTRTPIGPTALVVVLAAVAARGVARTVIGGGLGVAAGAPAGTRLPLALGFWSTGMLPTVVALACALRFNGQLGELILSASTVMTVAGELIGPMFLRRALTANGQAVEPPSHAEPAP
jgi:hypothetical protein